jgi:hypothetical protein
MASTPRSCALLNSCQTNASQTHVKLYHAAATEKLIVWVGVQGMEETKKKESE